MAFNSNPPKQSYQATAGQTAFPYLFKMYIEDYMAVYQTPLGGDTVKLDLFVDYVVSIDGDNGGTVTLVSGAAQDDYIVLQRELPLDRLVEYQTSGDLLANTLNADQDYQTYLSADVAEDMKSTLRINPGSPDFDGVVPNPVSESYLRWNVAANGLENDVTPPTWRDETVVARDEAVASASAAATSESNAATHASSASFDAARASTSADEAASSVASIGDSVSEAEASANAAATSVMLASDHEDAAKNAANNAEQYRDEALVSKNSASSSASSALTSKNTSATNASNAGTSAASAATDASNANTAAASSNTYASNSATSASNAATSETHAHNSEISSGGSSAEALSSANLAEEWAQKAEDVEVETGLYSAFHWAQKAEGTATGIDSNGSDANGHWLRFTNGWMIQYGSIGITVNTLAQNVYGSTSGDLYKNSANVTLPSSFVDTDFVPTVTAKEGAAGAAVQIGSNQFKVDAYHANNGQFVLVYWTAMGQWK